MNVFRSCRVRRINDEGSYFPVSMRDRQAQAFAARSVAVRPGHLCRGSSFVNEHHVVGIEVGLGLEPVPAPPQDVGTILLGGVPGLFLRVMRCRSKKRQIVPMPAGTPTFASSAWISASVMSDLCSMRPRIRAA
jgi:hypothetical protein